MTTSLESLQKITVLLVDDHALVRGALAGLLSREPGFEVVGASESAAEAVALSRTTRPSIVVMDVDMPGLSCFDAARRIKSQVPESKVIFLSALAHERYFAMAADAGASGYITKGESPTILIDAIRRVFAGETLLPGGDKPDGPPADGFPVSKELPKRKLSTLTSREMEVFIYLAQGMRKKEIADLMSLSVKTVERHSENIMEKLDIHDRVGLSRLAIAEGLIQANGLA